MNGRRKLMSKYFMEEGYVKAFKDKNYMTVIGDGAFTNCYRIETMDMESVVTVEQKAFYNCIAMKSVKLGDRAEIVGYRAFVTARI